MDCLENVYLVLANLDLFKEDVVLPDEFGDVDVHFHCLFGIILLLHPETGSPGLPKLMRIII
jgi:hypothetical protein